MRPRSWIIKSCLRHRDVASTRSSTTPSRSPSEFFMMKNMSPIHLITACVMSFLLSISSFAQSGGNRSPNINWGDEAYLTMKCSKIQMAFWGFNINTNNQEAINVSRRLTGALREFSLVLAVKANIPQEKFERETKSYTYPLSEKIISGRTTKQESSQAVSDSNNCIDRIMSNSTLLEMFRPIYQNYNK